MSDTQELKDSVDLDAYYSPFAVKAADGQIHWYSPVTGEIVLIQRIPANA